MKINECELNEIRNWISINREPIKRLYNTFLYVCNEKYDLRLMDSKQLYFDLCLYFYYHTYDKYGITFFNSKEERDNYYNSKKNDKVYYYHENNIIENQFEIKENEDYVQKENDYETRSDYETKSDYESSDCSSSECDNNIYFETYVNNYSEEVNEEIYNKFFNDIDKNDPKLYHFTPKNNY